LQAKSNLGLIPKETYIQMRDILTENKIDLEWWKNRDQEIGHDLNAFLDERLRILPPQFHQYYHKKMTSYDTEESPFAITLQESLEKVGKLSQELMDTLKALSQRYRYTIMIGRTHGQAAELQTFGKRVLTWFKDCRIAYDALIASMDILEFSKLSGAIGNYGSLSPEVEAEALRILGLKPYYGATQIMPRVLYAPIAQSLCNLALVIHKIALDIRLNSRSGLPLLQEPFGKKQKGSSAMPQKKNPILLEQAEGLARMAKGYMNMITDDIVTWEERAIEQSGVERVAWPDIFHVVIRALTVMKKVLSGLTVYPDNMLQEVIEARGTYAASEVTEFLKANLSDSGLSYEDVYRLVQLACFNVFESSPLKLSIRGCPAESLLEAANQLKALSQQRDGRSRYKKEPMISLEDFIPKGELRVSEELDISPENVTLYNGCLKDLFPAAGDPESERERREILAAWHQIFTPEFLLRHEAVLYWHILAE